MMMMKFYRFYFVSFYSFVDERTAELTNNLIIQC